MKLAEAKVKAEAIVAKLQPLCSNVAVAGSIRRRKTEVGDIDLVAVPQPAEIGEHKKC